MFEFLRLAREFRKMARLLLQWEHAVQKEVPLWNNRRLYPIHPSEKFFLKLEEIQKVLDHEGRRDLDPLDVIGYLLKEWPSGLLGYDADYTMREAGVFDEGFSLEKEKQQRS